MPACWPAAARRRCTGPAGPHVGPGLAAAATTAITCTDAVTDAVTDATANTDAGAVAIGSTVRLTDARCPLRHTFASLVLFDWGSVLSLGCYNLF